MVGNGDFGGDEEFIILAAEGAEDVRPVDPADVGHLDGIEVDVRGKGVGVAADHERRGEGPGLGGVVAHIADGDAGFFHDLAADGLFDGFSLVDESGEGGVHLHAGQAAAGLAEDAAVAAGDNDDDDGIGAGEVLGAAVGAFAHLAAASLVGWGAADAAIAMADVPVDLGAALGDDAGVGGGEDGPGGADLLELQFAVEAEGGDRVREIADIDGEVGDAVAESEETGRGGDRQVVDMRGAQPGGGGGGVAVEENVELVKGQEAAGGIADAVGEPAVVTTLTLAAVERIGAEYVRVFQDG